ncbi:tRNA A64-2'-O-ribosylphosphate transferase [Hypoxylon texense]
MTYDPNFNPNFTNDVRLQDRGWWKNIVHFVEKHNSEGLFDAASAHITSHLEFGGCLMDFNGLKTRYENIRRLEDVDDIKHHGFPHVPPQVRFVQFYTVCHGYPKKPKGGDSDRNPADPETPRGTGSASPAPQISSPSHKSPASTPNPVDAILEEDAPPKYTPYADDDGSSLEFLDPEPMSDEVEPLNELKSHDQDVGDKKIISESGPSAIKPTTDGSDIKTDTQQTHESSLSQGTPGNASEATTDLVDEIAALGLNLPTIPELPVKPEQPDLDQYTDKDSRKKAEKEAKQVNKEYAKLVKDRDKTIKERQKIIDKGKKKATQETEKREKEERKRRQKEEKAAAMSASSKEKAGPSATQPQSSEDLQADLDSYAMSPLPEQSRGNPKPPKQPKERKFCTLPHKVDGQVDPKWVKIFMKDMDQVAAHTSLFFRGEHYERFVCHVGETVESWVQEDMTKRTILEMG